MYLMRMIYYSHNQIRSNGGKVTDELKQILSSCAKNNPQNGISGALLFSQKYFAQILEGDRKAITETFIRISQDNRHSDIVILNSMPIDKRQFLNWSMTFAGQTEVADLLYNEYSPTTNFNPAKMTAESLAKLIERLVEVEKNVAKTQKQKATVSYS